MENQPIDYLKTAIEESAEEQLTDEEIGLRLDIVEADPDDYSEDEYYDEDEEYTDEDDYECIDTPAWEDFVALKDKFIHITDPGLRQVWSTVPPTVQCELKEQVDRISAILQHIHIYSEDYRDA